MKRHHVWLGIFLLVFVIPMHPRARGLQNPLSLRLDPAQQTVEEGDNALTTTAVSGGTQPYKYEWYDGSRKSTVTRPNVVWVMRRASVHAIKLVVTDAAGSSVEATVQVSVRPATVSQTAEAPPADGSPAPLSVRITPPLSQIESGGKVTSYAVATGGVAPYSYEWWANNTKTVAAADHSAWRVQDSGIRDIKVVVTDAAGNHAEGHAFIVIKAADGE